MSRRVVQLLVSGALVAAMAAPVAAAVDDAKLEKATREVLDRRYQRELPIGKFEIGPNARSKGGRPKTAPGRTKGAPDRARHQDDEGGVSAGLSAVMRMI